VGDQADDNALESVLSREAAVGRDHHSDQGHVDECQVEEGHVVEQNDSETDENIPPLLRVTLVEGGAQGTGRFEGLGLASEPTRENERANDAECDIRRHPELVARATLASVVARGDEKRELGETVDDRRREARPNEPVQLVLVCIGHELLTPEENDGDGEQGSSEEQGV